MSHHHRRAAAVSAPDPYFSNTVLLLTGNGTNGGQNNTFIDSSSNNFTITRFGNTTQGSFSPFGWQWSNYFDGTGDYLALGGQTNFEFSTGNFTVELWLYLNTTSGAQLVYDGRPLSTQTTQPTIYIANGGSVRYYTGNADRITGSTLNARQWYHIAVSRSGTSTRLFIDGTQSGSTYSDSTSYTNTTGRPVIGIDGFNMNANYLNGYISSLRVLKGTAQYTSNFTPPAEPLTAITNTQLLTCQSNRFVDNSSNAFAITRNGDVTVSNFAPFPAGEYATAVEGGSGYFDGSGDYLGITGVDLSSTDFTIECWAYFTSFTANTPTIFNFGTDVNNRYGLYRTSGGKFDFFTANSGSYNLKDGTTSPVVGTWYHLAVVSSGGTRTLYVNGTSEATSTSAINAGTNWAIGFVQFSVASANYMTGYISSFRVVKSAVYTANFTPPTAPLTTITDTQLLLNFTNGSVVDATGKNDLETVGDAQISTATKKFGTGSLKFDGTGDRLVIPYKSDLLLGSGNFTVEMWLYKNANTAYMTACGNLSTANSSAWQVLGDSTGNKIAWYSSNAFQLTSTSSLATSTWHHVAFVRNGTFFKLYLNGTEEASATNSVNFNVTNNLWIGHTPENISGRDWNGYIDDLRITKGVARYTSNFTPPYRQLPTR